jgi:hypothetical protein
MTASNIGFREPLQCYQKIPDQANDEQKVIPTEK